MADRRDMGHERDARLFHGLCRWVAVAGVIVQLVLVLSITQQLPWRPVAGGPDETLHRSLSLYISRHLEWPSWDSEELVRFRSYNCLTYATLSSAGYWVEGVSVRVLGRERLSGVLLLLLLLLPALCALRRTPQVSLALVAFLSPQALFVFGYVNSDSWTAVVALMLGIAIARFLQSPGIPSRQLWLFVAAGACLSCRPHMWPIGALAGALALFPKLPLLWRTNRRALALAALAGILVASWWPATSYIANADPIGFAATERSIEQFCPPDPPQRNKPWGEFPVVDFLSTTSRSLYGLWGWLAVPLPTPAYLIAALLVGIGGGWLVYVLPGPRRLIGIVFAANVILLVVYGMVWDYQPQGRYLFPGYFIGLGILASDLGAHPERWPARRGRWLLAGTLTALLVWNLGASSALLSRSVAIGVRRPGSPGASVPIRRPVEVRRIPGADFGPFLRDSSPRQF